MEQSRDWKSNIRQGDQKITRFWTKPRIHYRSLDFVLSQTDTFKTLYFVYTYKVFLWHYPPVYV